MAVSNKAQVFLSILSMQNRRLSNRSSSSFSPHRLILLGALIFLPLIHHFLLDANFLSNLRLRINRAYKDMLRIIWGFIDIAHFLLIYNWLKMQNTWVGRHLCLLFSNLAAIPLVLFLVNSWDLPCYFSLLGFSAFRIDDKLFGDRARNARWSSFLLFM